MSEQMCDFHAQSPADLLLNLKKVDSLLNKNREEPSTGFLQEFKRNSKAILLRLVSPSVRAYINGIRESPELIYHSNNIVQGLIQAPAFDIDSDSFYIYGNGYLIGLESTLKFLETLWNLVHSKYDQKQEVDFEDSSYYRELVFSFELIKEIFISVLSIAAMNKHMIEWILEIEPEAKSKVFASELYSVAIKCCLEINLSCEIENLISSGVTQENNLPHHLSAIESFKGQNYEFKQYTIIRDLSDVYNNWNSEDKKLLQNDCDYRIEAELTVLKTFAIILSKTDEGFNESNTVIQNLKTPLQSSNESPRECYKYYLTNRQLVPAWTNIFNMPSGSLMGTYKENTTQQPPIPEDATHPLEDKRNIYTDSFGLVHNTSCDTPSESSSLNHLNEEEYNGQLSNVNAKSFWHSSGTKIDLKDDMICNVRSDIPLKSKRNNIKDWFWSIWYPVDTLESNNSKNDENQSLV